MEIAIIAHDLKKELMAQFCIAYCGILANHHICATASTAQYISEATGLQIDRLMSGEHGGEQQIASRVAFNEIDVLLYFRAPNGNARTVAIENELCQQFGRNHEQSHGKHNGKEYRNLLHNPRHVDFVLFFQPLFRFRLLVIVLDGNVHTAH